MNTHMERVAVIGAGTMGAAIAAQLADAGLDVLLLDIIPFQLTQQEKDAGLTINDRAVRNRLATQGVERVKISKPPNFENVENASRIIIGNLEDDFDALENADWIIEAIIENLEAKRNLMARIERVRKPSTLVSTNTSGILISQIAEGFSDSFRENFIGTHFFNPPRYMKLLEIIPTKDTLPENIDKVRDFCAQRLGKGVVLCKDSPNFIANRVGFGCGAYVLSYVLENGYTVEEVDAITGPVIGRPKTATFRLIDLVGIDIWDHIISNLAVAIPHDQYILPYLQSDRANFLIRTMIDKGWLGNKAGKGFYHAVAQPDGSKEFRVLDLNRMDHIPPSAVHLPTLEKVKEITDLRERLRVVLGAQDRGGQLARAVVYQNLVYASQLIPEVADTPAPIDDAMRWGFGYSTGPFEIWDLLGVRDILPAMEMDGYPVAEWVYEMLDCGNESFYHYDGSVKLATYEPGKRNYSPLSM